MGHSSLCYLMGGPRLGPKEGSSTVPGAIFWHCPQGRCVELTYKTLLLICVRDKPPKLFVTSLPGICDMCYPVKIKTHLVWKKCTPYSLSTRYISND